MGIKRIENANEIEVGDEMRAGAIKSKVVAIDNGTIVNERGERCPIGALNGFMLKGSIIVNRWS